MRNESVLALNAMVTSYRVPLAATLAIPSKVVSQCKREGVYTQYCEWVPAQRMYECSAGLPTHPNLKLSSYYHTKCAADRLSIAELLVKTQLGIPEYIYFHGHHALH